MVITLHCLKMGQMSNGTRTDHGCDLRWVKCQMVQGQTMGVTLALQF